MTGLAEDLGGAAPDLGTVLHPDDLPMRLIFEGQRYIVNKTKLGGLVMTKEIIPVR